ncbi:MAG: ABC transporter ATP-binding protein [Solirubrobacterales bacterium]|nr:ABC transporter ATP-binding protein [Solirubrobacterales bacterium]
MTETSNRPSSPPDGTPGRGPVLAARDIGKRFGDVEVLNGVSFQAAPGEVVGLIGPNGAGKTTLLSILAGIEAPDGGRVESGGGVGWVPQQAALYRRLTVRENLLLFARLQRSGRPDERVVEMLELTGLGDRMNDQVGKLSGGNQQRVNIAIGLMADPSVLLLDEPSVGLDPAQRARLWRFVLDLVDRGTAVVFSTHDIQEAERYAGRIVVLTEGLEIFDGTADELREAVVTGAADSGPGERDLETSFLAYLDKDGR